MEPTRTDRVTVADGTFDASTWLPPKGSGPGLVLLQEIFGVGPYIRAVAERLAGLGYVVAAPDLFWRTHPGWAAAHDEAGLSASFQAVSQLDFPSAIADSVATLEHLAEVDEVVGTPGVIGFCLGGTLAWAVAAAAEPSVCVSYYGSGVAGMLDAAERVDCPVIFHFGDADAYIPMSQVEEIRPVVTAHPTWELHVQHAGHAFDNHESEMFWVPDAASAAWDATTRFLAAHLPT